MGIKMFAVLYLQRNVLSNATFAHCHIFVALYCIGANARTCRATCFCRDVSYCAVLDGLFSLLCGEFVSV